MRRIYVVESYEDDAWHARSGHTEKNEALDACRECRSGEGGSWRVTTYKPIDSAAGKDGGR